MAGGSSGGGGAAKRCANHHVSHATSKRVTPVRTRRDSHTCSVGVKKGAEGI
jgi:hypothetical protein